MVIHPAHYPPLHQFIVLYDLPRGSKVQCGFPSIVGVLATPLVGRMKFQAGTKRPRQGLDGAFFVDQKKLISLLDPLEVFFAPVHPIFALHPNVVDRGRKGKMDGVVRALLQETESSL